MQIVHLKINNFRGIKSLSQTFNMPLVCLIGRGDSGKSTILEAIAYVLSGGGGIEFYDNDFYNCDTSNPITIEATIRGVPENFWLEDKFGLYTRSFKDNILSDDLGTDPLANEEKVLTIALKVDSSLEPRWHVKTDRPNQEPKEIYWADRAKIKVFMVSDYNDKHFSWSKGFPLYTWLQRTGTESNNETILEAIREVKVKIDESSFAHFQEITNNIVKEASLLGANIETAKTSIDFRDINIKEGRLCFHEDKVPFRLKGKGNKRLLSIAIQKLLIKQGGVALIDELEQGLEPDRIKQLIRNLKRENNGQLFVTTHSPSIVEELPCDDVMLVNRTAEETITTPFPAEKQAIVRIHPDAWYAKKIIVCEGATEVGFCRAIDNYLQETEAISFASKDVFYIDGGGDPKFFDKANEIKQMGLEVIIVCDNDRESSVQKKSEMEVAEINIFDCEQGNSFEKQIVKDANKEVLAKILNFISLLKTKYEHLPPKKAKTILWNEIEHGITLPVELDKQQVKDSIALYLGTENRKIRLKSIEYGEGIGDIICNSLNSFEGKRTKETITKVINWVKNDGLQ